MALINCPECGKEISDQCKRCIHCGYSLRKKYQIKEKKKNRWVLFLTIPAILLIAGLLVVLISKKHEPEKTSYVTYEVEIDGVKYQVSSEEEANELINKHLYGGNNSASSAANGTQSERLEEKQMIEVVGGAYEGFSYGFHHFSFTAKNISDEPVNTVSLNINILDKDGNIVNTAYPQEHTTIEPGQTLIFGALNDGGRNASSAVVSGYSLIDSSNNHRSKNINSNVKVEFEASAATKTEDNKTVKNSDSTGKSDNSSSNNSSKKGSSSSSGSSYISDDLKAALYTYAIKKVKAHLKSPSSAKFPVYSKCSFEKNGDVYMIAGYVDADNAFGANIRETWGVMVEYDGVYSTLVCVTVGDNTYLS